MSKKSDLEEIIKVMAERMTDVTTWSGRLKEQVAGPNGKMTPILRKRSLYVGIAKMAIYVSMAVFMSYAAECVCLGGNADEKASVSGKYFLRNHSELVEVSRAVFRLNVWHGRVANVAMGVWLFAVCVLVVTDHGEGGSSSSTTSE